MQLYAWSEENEHLLEKKNTKQKIEKLNMKSEG